MKILILCTGNSCRSQMAHGFLQSFDKDIQVYSAGTHPAEKVNPLAVEAMAEVGIDISRHIPTNVTAYLSDTWDYVITVCGSANEMCPAFEGNVGKRLHMVLMTPRKQQEQRTLSEANLKECVMKSRMNLPGSTLQR